MPVYSPGTRIGQYEIASRPMKGGMGVVYFAIDHNNDDRPVALKTLRSELLSDHAARDRFLREGTAWVELRNHPHIVRCYEVKYVDPIAFLALELINKKQNMPDASLRSWLIPGHPLAVEQTLLFAVQIARGMQYAAKRIPGFVHRDLKPENILVGADKLPGSNANQLRVTDLGLAKIVGSARSLSYENVRELKPNEIKFTRGAGTPLYMAPEQWKGESVGAFTDVYAFGAILYEMLCGQFAARGYTLTELATAHCQGDLRLLPGNFPQPLHRLLGRSLTPDIEQRYQTWNEVTDAIEEVYTELELGPLPPEYRPGIEHTIQLRSVASSYMEMGTSYLDMGQIRLAIDYYENSLRILHAIGDPEGEGTALGNLGNAYIQHGDAREANRYSERALNLARQVGDRQGESVYLSNLGITHANLGDSQLAIDYYEQALAIAEEIGDLRGESAVLINLGIEHRRLGHVKNAIDYLELALTRAQTIGDRRREGQALGNLGNVYANLGDTESALESYEKALDTLKQIGDRRGEGKVLCNIGIVYHELGKTRRAIETIEQALQIDREIEDLSSVASTSFKLATLYSEEHDVARALVLAQEAAKLWSTIGSPQAQQAHQLVAKLEGIPANPAQAAYRAFQHVDSLEEMQATIEQHPMLTNSDFIQAITEIIDEEIPPEEKSLFEKRLTWLRQVASEQKGGVFRRLFGTKR